MNFLRTKARERWADAYRVVGEMLPYRIHSGLIHNCVDSPNWASCDSSSSYFRLESSCRSTLRETLRYSLAD